MPFVQEAMLDALVLGESTCRCESVYQGELQSHLAEPSQLTGLKKMWLLQKQTEKQMRGRGDGHQQPHCCTNMRTWFRSQHSLKTGWHGCAACAIGVAMEVCVSQIHRVALPDQWGPFQWEILSQRERWKVIEYDTWCWPLASTCVYTCAHKRTPTHPHTDKAK